MAARAAEELGVMARLRELAPLTPVRAEVIERENMERWLLDKLDREVPSRALEGTQTLFIALGVAPVSFSYRQSVVAMMTAQLAGFYDPEEKALYLLADLEPALLDQTLSHELVHALQDQHYDLGPKLAWEDGASDRLAALHALAEGDATSAMFERMGASLEAVPEMHGRDALGVGLELFALPDNTPQLLLRGLLAPYTDGLELVAWARKRGGWPLVDELWRRPPVSTEQVLHPEKWLEGELPEEVAVPPAPPLGPSALLHQDVLGEQGLRLLFEEWLPLRAARRSAEDFGGDRLAVFADENGKAIAWHLRFDSEPAAKRAELSLHRGLLAEKPEMLAALSATEAEARIRRGQSCRERSELGPISVARRGRDVLLLAGPFEHKGELPKSLGTCAHTRDWAKRILRP